ncbi:L-aspartate--glyoxylate aminotransferase BhcA [Algicella marina]|uniref:Aminotransferase class V-fold PLP-dependent enzyme n=1 Tax=Algicella marina TaxID=2683284 RepID=A0A6P1T5D8_9RHOB|nr:L-aspartate--glyoxylate aminotransferase BhcA [Algicella marina]QHQ36930.1 aminotransferase class V-fold PLP-dependent enzyme [Algicella marina]
MSGQNPVFIPGPTNIPDRIRHAMNVQTLDHRAPDFIDVFAPVLADLRKVFKTTSGTPVLFAGSGTGGWEAALTNTLSPGDKVLIARFGMFSHRWIDMCERLGLEVEVIECEWGAGAPADLYGEALASDTAHSIRAVLVTHNETATGVVSDIGAIRRAMDACGHPALLFADAVSSLGSIDFRMEEWGVDICVAGSQKGFMLSTGMAIICVSAKALAAAETAGLPRCYFDIREMTKANAKGGFPYTPPLNLIMGLRESLDMIFEEGLENVFARHARLAEGVRKAAAAWGMELCAHSPELYSNSVTAVVVPEGFDATRLINHAYDTYGMSFGVGLGEVAGKVFRIGHLGSLTDAMVLSGLATIEMAMKDLNYPITLGSGVAAAQEHYRTTANTARAEAA